LAFHQLVVSSTHLKFASIRVRGAEQSIKW